MREGKEMQPREADIKKRKRKKVKKKKESVFNLYWSLIPFKMGKESHRLPRLWLYRHCCDTSVDLSLHHCVVAFARMLRHFTNPSLHGHIFFFDKIKKKEKKPVLRHVGVFLSNAGEFPRSWLQAPCSLPRPPTLPHRLDRGRQKGCLRFFSFCSFPRRDSAQQSSLFFIFHWCEGVQSLSERNHWRQGSKDGKKKQASLAFLWGLKLPEVNCSHKKKNWWCLIEFLWK